MEQEDHGFFILVLGVLAAILMIVIWSHVADDDGVASRFAATGTVADNSDDDQGDEQAASDTAPATPTPEPAPTATAAPAPEPTVEELAPAATVFDGVFEDENLSVVAGLLRAAGLDEELAEEGPFTVLAPSNDAISDATGSDTTYAVLEADQAAVLTYHVIPGTYDREALAEVARGATPSGLLTVQGEPLTLTLDGEDVIVNGNARLVGDSRPSENGVVHTLDNLLVPPVAALNTLVELEPILFASGSATIEQASFETLDTFIDVLAGTDVDVTIEGHTDSQGDAILNQNLSQSRARSVLNYLVANGVDDQRLSAEGFGAANPVADNGTEAGRASNRRIEFSLG